MRSVLLFSAANRVLDDQGLTAILLAADSSTSATFRPQLHTHRAFGAKYHSCHSTASRHNTQDLKLFLKSQRIILTVFAL